jgi:copper chaperone
MSNDTATFTVTGMTCGHCVAAVTEEVSRIDNVTSVEIDLPTGAVTVHSTGPVDPVAFAAAVDEAGYEVPR